MPNILDYYQYAQLSTAAYVRLDDEPTLSGDRVSFQAASQSRMPTAIANLMFDPQSNEAIAANAVIWTIPTSSRGSGYSGNDAEVFAATLFHMPLTYKTIVHMNMQDLVAQGVKYSLAPGMQVAAEIHLGTRTVLEYLLSPVTQAFHEAGRER